MSSIFGGRRPAPPPHTADAKPETIIGATTSIHGDVKAEGTLRVDGLVEGTIESTGNVVVGPTGRVSATVNGQNVLVAGVVRGNITAGGRLEIVASGKVWGDITVRSLLIEEGGLFRGQSIMRDESTPDALPEPAAEDPAPDRPAKRGEAAARPA
jgi:cytoskeletal protein CcmA (bactofilin family)